MALERVSSWPMGPPYASAAVFPIARPGRVPIFVLSRPRMARDIFSARRAPRGTRRCPAVVRPVARDGALPVVRPVARDGALPVVRPVARDGALPVVRPVARDGALNCPLRAPCRPCTTQRLPLEQPPPLLHSVQPPLPHPAPALAAAAPDLPAPTLCSRSAAFSPPTPSSFVSLQPWGGGYGGGGCGGDGWCASLPLLLLSFPLLQLPLGEGVRVWGSRGSGTGVAGVRPTSSRRLHLSSLPPSAALAAVWGGGGGGG
ncbi:unnamed protein product [Closterium sp. NIES-53]